MHKKYYGYTFKYYRPNYQNSPPLPGPLAVKGKTIKVQVTAKGADGTAPQTATVTFKIRVR